MPPIIRRDWQMSLTSTQGGKVSRPRLIVTTLPHPLRLRNQIRLDHRSNLLLPLHLGREMTCQRSSLHLEEQHNSRPQLLQGAKETNPGQCTSNLLAIRTVSSYIVLYTMHVAMSFMSLKFYINFVGFGLNTVLFWLVVK